MSFSFTGLDNLSISSEDYLWEGAGVPGVYCLGIQQMDNSELFWVMFCCKNTIQSMIDNKKLSDLGHCPLVPINKT